MLLRAAAFPPLLSRVPHKSKLPRSPVLSTTTPQPARPNASPTPGRRPPPTSAYVHLPFCRKRCHYCDFPIVALGSSSPPPPRDATAPDSEDPRIASYVRLLCREIAASTRPDSPAGPSLRTVFFGGGTPSLVSPALLSQVLDALRSNFGVSDDAEVSMEVDPGTFDEKALRGYAGLGVNRVSLGVQAFQEELLRGCGRAHGAKEVMEAIEMVGSSGIENWSMDLISSLPHQTVEMWEETLSMAVRAGPKHMSVYDLQVEQGTKFGLWYKPGEYPLPSEDESAVFYRRASEMLRDAGFNHYEISSYCKEGYECKHNLAYWENKSFYGFGLGSASCLGGVRFSRPKRMKEYTAYVERLEGGSAVEESSGIADSKDLAMDVVMLSLRMSRGLDVKQFERDFGRELLLSLCGVLRPYVQSGHVVGLNEEGRALSATEFGLLLSENKGVRQNVASLRLSDPDGFLLSNELISIAFGVISP